jgi:hypothetical protein
MVFFFWICKYRWGGCSCFFIFVILQIELGNYDSFYESGRVFAASEVTIKLKYQNKQSVV